MKSMLKKMSLLVPAILVISCNRIDKHSSIGSDVIAAVDSSAVSFDGVFHTEKISPQIGDWITIKDSLSGLHRYKDYLARGYVGNIQSEVFIGKFNGEESFAYTTFYSDEEQYDTILSASGIKDSVITNHIGQYVDSLFKAGCNKVTTSLTFLIDTSGQKDDFYNIELSTLPFYKDSTVVDTSRRHVMQNILIPAKRTVHTVDLPYTFYQKNDSETFTKTDVTGLFTSQNSHTVITTVEKWYDGIKTATILNTLPTVTVDSAYNFTSNEILPFYYFSNVDSTIEGSTVGNITQYKYSYTADSTSNKTITKTVNTVVNADDTIVYDTLTYPDTSVTTQLVTRTYDTTGTGIDSTVTIIDSAFVWSKISVTQMKTTTLDSVDFASTRSSGYTPGDTLDKRITELDTMSILFKNISENSNSVLKLRSVIPNAQFILNIAGHKDETSDTLRTLPKRATMTVFNHGEPVVATMPTASAGLESFVRLKVNMDAFWSLLKKDKYLNIVETKIKVPVKSSDFTEYGDSTIGVRAIFHDENLTNGALLSDSGSRSTNVYYHSDSSYLSIDINDYVLDMLYGSMNSVIYKNSTAAIKPNYLYLWIDGSKMGRINFDKNRQYNLTYIVQNKLN